MNDENLEQNLRSLSAPELPEAWRQEILSRALREARVQKATAPVWPRLLVTLRNLFALNPFTVSALTALSLLIFYFRATTPVDPSNGDVIVNLDSKRPVYFASLQDKIQLARLLQDQPDIRQDPQIP